MYIDIGYSENRHIDTYIVYIHIYSWDKGVHPPAWSWENTKTLISTQYLVSNPTTTSISDVMLMVWCVVMTIRDLHIVSAAVDFNDTRADVFYLLFYSYHDGVNKINKSQILYAGCSYLKLYSVVCVWDGVNAGGELLLHREVTGVFQVLIDTIMLFHQN